MKNIAIIHSNMEIGGAETSLIGLLQSLDYSKVSVTLFLYETTGSMLSFVPKQVAVKPAGEEYEALVSPIKTAIRKGYFLIAASRLLAKAVCAAKNKFRHYTDFGYIVKQRSHYYALPFLPQLDGEYDLAISFNDPHFILNKKIKAKKKLGWFHTDFSRITTDSKLEEKMWSTLDSVITVSEQCKKAFDEKHPTLQNKSIVIENILSQAFVEKRAEEFTVDEMKKEAGETVLLSVGRFSKAKNFDNVPEICSLLRQQGLNVKWYLVGYGGDEELIKSKIAEAGMQEYVIVLGKKENPYPYIKACDVYVQPSRYEGKAVTVREAQILNKPVVITAFETSASQLTDGFDGVIVPMDNEGCANGIAAVLRNRELQQKLIGNTKKTDYTNSAEIEKLYRMVE